jgi:hypothetical protein
VSFEAVSLSEVSFSIDRITSRFVDQSFELPCTLLFYLEVIGWIYDLSQDIGVLRVHTRGETLLQAALVNKKYRDSGS